MLHIPVHGGLSLDDIFKQTGQPAQHELIYNFAQLLAGHYPQSLLKDVAIEMAGNWPEAISNVSVSKRYKTYVYEIRGDGSYVTASPEGLANALRALIFIGQGAFAKVPRPDAAWDVWTDWLGCDCDATEFDQLAQMALWHEVRC